MESLLGYSFRDMALLEESLTHCSWPQPPCNQRLEFLGDAVMDLLVTDFIFNLAG